MPISPSSLGRSLLTAGTLALTSATLVLPTSGCGAEDETEVEVDNPELPATLGGPARGISITTVEANQGVGVSLAEGADYVGSDARSAKLVRNRDTLIRFLHVLDDPDNWVPRELTGILHLLPPDGGPELLRVRTFTVEKDADPRRLNENFFFSLLADEAVPGTRFWLELRETDSAVDVSSLSEGVTLTPPEPELIGFEPAQLDMEVVIVPVDYLYPDPPRFPDIEARDIGIFRDDLLQQNPLQEVKISIREEPLVWEEQLTNLSDLLSPTRALRQDDGAPPHVYYHALVDNGGPSVNMVAGIAWLTNDSKDDADRRVAATVYYKRVTPPDEETGEPGNTFDPTGSSRTWVHEIGHNQGLRHVYCAGADSANPDPDYPHDNGKIGVYGFGIRSFRMYTPSVAHDYMSYCGNSWVSDWTWNKTFERIETLTNWSLEAPDSQPAGPTQPTLVGTLNPDGSEQWWLFDAPVPAPERRSATQVIELSVDGELHERIYSEVDVLSDGETLVISAPLPAELDLEGEVELARVGLDGVPHAIELAELQRPANFVRAQRELLSPR